MAGEASLAAKAAVTATENRVGGREAQLVDAYENCTVAAAGIDRRVAADVAKVDAPG
jgi:hypothetical protein